MRRRTVFPVAQPTSKDYEGWAVHSKTLNKAGAFEGVYRHLSFPPRSGRSKDRGIVAEIHAAREGYRSVYGVRKTWKELHRRGIDVGRDRVARLMRQEGLEGVRRGKKRRTTLAD